MRLDGFTDLELKTNRREGSFTTIPIQPGTASQLILNADGGPSGHLEVELLDGTTHQPLPDYSRAECLPLRGDSIRHGVTWKKHKDLSGVRASSFQIKVYLVGERATPKLYSIEFK